MLMMKISCNTAPPLLFPLVHVFHSVSTDCTQNCGVAIQANREETGKEVLQSTKKNHLVGPLATKHQVCLIPGNTVGIKHCSSSYIIDYVTLQMKQVPIKISSKLLFKTLKLCMIWKCISTWQTTHLVDDWLISIQNNTVMHLML